PTAPSPLVQSEALTPPPTVEKPTAFSGIVPPRATDQPPALAPLEANSDFLPGSLDDLFGVTSQQPAQSHLPAQPPPVSPSNAKVQKDFHSQTAPNFPAGGASGQKQRPPVDLRSEPKQPEVTFQPPSVVQPPKKEDRKVSESLEAVPPPPPSVP